MTLQKLEELAPHVLHAHSLRMSGYEYTAELVEMIPEILAALRVAGEGWQDISTAPRDGADVQLWSAEGWTPKAHWCAKKGGWYEEYWDADWRSYSESAIYQPTHWRPLPAPPKEAE